MVGFGNGFEGRGVSGPNWCLSFNDPHLYWPIPFWSLAISNQNFMGYPSHDKMGYPPPKPGQDGVPPPPPGQVLHGQVTARVTHLLRIPVAAAWDGKDMGSAEVSSLQCTLGYMLFQSAGRCLVGFSRREGIPITWWTGTDRKEPAPYCWPREEGVHPLPQEEDRRKEGCLVLPVNARKPRKNNLLRTSRLPTKNHPHPDARSSISNISTACHFVPRT